MTGVRPTSLSQCCGGPLSLVTNRNRDKLDWVADDLPGIHTFRNDVGRPEERLRLAENVESHFPNLNIVLAAFCELPWYKSATQEFREPWPRKVQLFLEIICFTEFLRFHCRNQVPRRYPKSSAATVPVAEFTVTYVVKLPRTGLLANVTRLKP